MIRKTAEPHFEATFFFSLFCFVFWEFIFSKFLIQLYIGSGFYPENPGPNAVKKKNILNGTPVHRQQLMLNRFCCLNITLQCNLSWYRYHIVTFPSCTLLVSWSESEFDIRDSDDFEITFSFILFMKFCTFCTLHFNYYGDQNPID